MNVQVVPDTDRWRPTRAGLIALWRYWDETFTFHNGRLLLGCGNGPAACRSATVIVASNE